MKMNRFAWIAAAAVIAACDSPLDTEPTASIDAGTALTNKRGIDLGLNGAYRSLQGTIGSRVHLAYADLYADNFDFTGTFQSDREFSLRNVSADNTGLSDMWASGWVGINRANGIIAAVAGIEDMTDAQKAVARGEALFIRAVNYSYLVAWFGGVPIVTDPSTGVTEESNVARATRQEVLDFIEADLEEASTLLPATKTNGRAWKGAADALAARIYLEEGEYAKARDKATAVIGITSLRLVPFADIWRTKNSAESIFEIPHNVNNQNSLAFWYFTQPLGGRWGYAPSPALAAAFAANDTRLPVTIGNDAGSRFGNKYTRIANGDDNVVVLRLAEMYLIRAEANARLNADAAVVRADINVVRARAGQPALGADVDTQSELLDAILAERRLEFVQEGHRFFDLRRFGRAEAVLSIAPTRLVLPIPRNDLDVNPNLVQNPGY